MKFRTMSQVSSFSNATLYAMGQAGSSPAAGLPGGLELWRALGKVVLFALPLALTLMLALGAVKADLERAMEAGEVHQQQLIDDNIQLLAQRAGLYAPERVSRVAADKLSLYAAAPGQIERIN